jgi:hypothetical protein
MKYEIDIEYKKLRAEIDPLLISDNIEICKLYKQLRKQEIDTGRIVPATQGGCWFCETKTNDMALDTEFDTMVHLDCVRKEVEKDHPEAKIMYHEFKKMGYMK